ncbi:alpha-hydroxy-acid oxidizing protein [Lutimaribacter sp. EGI FJ00015]|uniref:Alpha-hydroxy-acid oxidizing protein n=1 Tax=Lutimaribacter degradans TaxID=2945989 RepID=A0ACC5ZQU9_9RHOB|nr:alpha-hydroxy acid oxidase [Lutimaribacter sp. EGI FJ00013]MCM2560666.1 alpha-hydroxy-acid oxidizing protein [Lutimaribacter sp. EGI FJ00013]MCO0612390.1 alpha-hydroxy-acid oxidizing protein [Lutimaribacter sp. EGI FJ00015]MCO0634490.1 alpha-hydroxy-acid oxidizing protein [Lutimaribacter sp. EGI FJ00014]
MDLHTLYPGLDDLKRRARARLPHFVWEYLDSATGAETTKARNRAQLDEILMRPSILHGPLDHDLSTRLMGAEWALPIGVAPVGMSGLVWPEAEILLARNAARANIPYCLSTVACKTPEQVGRHAQGRGWFQLYPPKDPEIRRDMVRRARDAGFDTLVLTVDLPAPSRRERQTRSGITQPPRLTPRLLTQIARRPHWALATAMNGRPRMPTIAKYADDTPGMAPTEHIGYILRTSPDWEYLRWLRDNWQGAFVVKGVLNPQDATALEAEGVDGIWVSNHAGRQFDAAPASIEVLPAIRAATTLPIIFDSGVGGGLDVLRAVALGADMVMMGRAWHYALAALGRDGPRHLTEMFERDIIANMGQVGATRLAEVADRLIRA